MTSTNEGAVELENLDELEEALGAPEGEEQRVELPGDDDEVDNFDIREMKIAKGEISREQAYAGIGDEDFGPDDFYTPPSAAPDEAFDEKPGRLPPARLRPLNDDDDDDDDGDTFDAKPDPLLRRMALRTPLNKREVDKMSTENNDDVMVEFVKSVVALRGGIDQLCKLVAENTETLKSFKGEIMSRLDEITDSTEYTGNQLVETSRMIETSVQTQRNVVENLACAMNDSVKNVVKTFDTLKDIILDDCPEEHLGGIPGQCDCDKCHGEWAGIPDQCDCDRRHDECGTSSTGTEPEEVRDEVENTREEAHVEPATEEAPKQAVKVQAKKEAPRPAEKKEAPKPAPQKKEAPKQAVKVQAKVSAKKEEPKDKKSVPGVVIYEEGWALKKDVESLVLRGNPKTGYTLSPKANGNGFAITRKTGTSVADVKFTGTAPAGEWMVCIDRKHESYFLARKSKMQKI